MTDPVAHDLLRAGQWTGAWDVASLPYADRHLRRKRLRTVRDAPFLVDLPHTVAAGHGDAFRLTDGRLIEIVAAEEPLLEIAAPDLTRIAWHVGNRHAPCQIEPGRLLVPYDPVMGDMAARLGAQVRQVIEPFHPEGGAYGQGRTHGHAH